MGNVESLLHEIWDSQVDRRRLAFLSVFVHFTDRAQWEQAATDATEQKWQVASYSQAGSYVLRLSYSCKPSAERLEKLRGVVQSFAAERGGTWESIAIERAEPASKWAEVADRYVPHAELSPTEPQARPAAAKQARQRRKPYQERSA
jgi:hypothetical protein